MLKKIPASIVRCAYASELRDIADIESFAAVFCDLRLPDVVDESKWVLEVYGRYPDTFFISGDPGLVDVGIKIYDKGSDSISGLLDTIEFS